MGETGGEVEVDDGWWAKKLVEKYSSKNLRNSLSKRGTLLRPYH